MPAPRAGVDRFFAGLAFRFQQKFARTLRDAEAFAAEVARADTAAPLAGLRYRLRREGLSAPLLAECFARYGAARGAGAAPATLAAARWIAGGGVAELEDPAARRDALGLAALAHALHGDTVHLLAASEAAAKALAEAIGAPLERLGQRVGVLARDAGTAARRELYAAPVVCAAYRDLGLDYLREGLQGGRGGALRGRLERLSGAATPAFERLQCALIEDADAVMLDEAQVPLMIAQHADQSRERLLYEQALELARALTEHEDYTVENGALRLTDTAARRLERLVAPLGGIWSARQRREQLLALALEALHFRTRDTDYRVENGQVQFPPPETPGREPEPDELELRKLVEVKEGARLSARPEVLARLSVPRFLGRYAALGGVCADAPGLETDFWSLYGLRTARAGLRARTAEPSPRVFVTAQARLAAVLDLARHAAQAGRPAVVAARSRPQAQALQAALGEAGLESPVLPLPLGASPDGKQWSELLVAELPVARRHIARAGRLLGAETCTLLLSLEDEALARYGWSARFAIEGELPAGWARWIAGSAQRATERLQRAIWQDIGARDRTLDDLLAVSGRGE